MREKLMMYLSGALDKTDKELIGQDRLQSVYNYISNGAGLTDRGGELELDYIDKTFRQVWVWNCPRSVYLNSVLVEPKSLLVVSLVAGTIKVIDPDDFTNVETVNVDVIAESGSQLMSFAPTRNGFVLSGIQQGCQGVYIDEDNNLITGKIGRPQAPTYTPDEYILPTLTKESTVGTGLSYGSIYGYCYTMVDEAGNESAPSPISYTTYYNFLREQVIDSSGDITDEEWYFDSIPVRNIKGNLEDYIGNKISFINIYRSSGKYAQSAIGMTPFYLVATLSSDIVSIIDRYTPDNEVIAPSDNTVSIGSDVVASVADRIFTANAIPYDSGQYGCTEFLEIKITNTNSRAYTSSPIHFKMTDSDLGDFNFSCNSLSSADKYRFFWKDRRTPMRGVFELIGSSPYTSAYITLVVPYISAGETITCYLGINYRAGSLLSMDVDGDDDFSSGKLYNITSSVPTLPDGCDEFIPNNRVIDFDYIGNLQYVGNIVASGTSPTLGSRVKSGTTTTFGVEFKSPASGFFSLDENYHTSILGSKHLITDSIRRGLRANNNGFVTNEVGGVNTNPFPTNSTGFTISGVMDIPKRFNRSDSFPSGEYKLMTISDVDSTDVYSIYLNDYASGGSYTNDYVYIKKDGALENETSIDMEDFPTVVVDGSAYYRVSYMVVLKQNNSSIDITVSMLAIETGTTQYQSDTISISGTLWSDFSLVQVGCFGSNDNTGDVTQYYNVDFINNTFLYDTSVITSSNVEVYKYLLYNTYFDSENIGFNGSDNDNIEFGDVITIPESDVNVLRWTDAGGFTFPSTNELTLSGNVVAMVGDSGKKDSYQNTLYLYYKHAMDVLTINPEGQVLKETIPLTANVSPTNEKAVRVIGGVSYIMSDKGIMRVTGQSVDNMTQRLGLTLTDYNGWVLFVREYNAVMFVGGKTENTRYPYYMYDIETGLVYDGDIFAEQDYTTSTFDMYDDIVDNVEGSIVFGCGGSVSTFYITPSKNESAKNYTVASILTRRVRFPSPVSLSEIRVNGVGGFLSQVKVLRSYRDNESSFTINGRQKFKCPVGTRCDWLEIQVSDYTDITSIEVYYNVL